MLAKFLSKRDEDKFCLNYWASFQNDAFQKEVAGNISEHFFGSKPLYQHFFITYDFQEMVINANKNESKLEEMWKNKDHSYTVKTGKLLPTVLVRSIDYFEDIMYEKKSHFCHDKIYCVDAFVEKMDKVLHEFTIFPKHEIFFVEERSIE